MWFVAGVGLMVFFFFFLLLVAGFLVELDTVVMWLSFGGAMMAVVG